VENGETSTHMMTILVFNSEELFSSCSLFYRNFRVEHGDNIGGLMSSIEWLLHAK